MGDTREGAGPRLRLRADDPRRYSSLFFSLPLSVKVNTAEWVEQFTHLGPFEVNMAGTWYGLAEILLRDSVIRTQDGNIWLSIFVIRFSPCSATPLEANEHYPAIYPLL